MFHSVQGEGAEQVIPHVFVRFGNCNLRCEWCDTDFLTYESYTCQEIIDKLETYDCKNVIFTGGEPMIHNLWPLQRQLLNLTIITYR